MKCIFFISVFVFITNYNLFSQQRDIYASDFAYIPIISSDTSHFENLTIIKEYYAGHLKINPPPASSKPNTNDSLSDIKFLQSIMADDKYYIQVFPENKKYFFFLIKDTVINKSSYQIYSESIYKSSLPGDILQKSAEKFVEHFPKSKIIKDESGMYLAFRNSRYNIIPDEKIDLLIYDLFIKK